jgi:hypothetical protein
MHNILDKISWLSWMEEERNLGFVFMKNSPYAVFADHFGVVA